jgi:hypothetical protein
MLFTEAFAAYIDKQTNTQMNPRTKLEDLWYLAGTGHGA